MVGSSILLACKYCQRYVYSFRILLNSFLNSHRQFYLIFWCFFILLDVSKLLVGFQIVCGKVKSDFTVKLDSVCIKFVWYFVVGLSVVTWLLISFNIWSKSQNMLRITLFLNRTIKPFQSVSGRYKILTACRCCTITCWCILCNFITT